MAMLWIIYYHVSNRLQVLDANTIFSMLFSSNLKIWVAVVVLLLMPLNWALESLKWKMVADTISPVTYKSAFTAVLGGIAAGFLLPNRVGEFAGKALMFPLRFFWQGIILSIFTSLAQLFITIIVGLFALWYFAPLASHYLQIGLQWTFLVIAIAGCLGLLFVYFNFQSISLIFRKSKRIFKVLNTLSGISFKLKIKILLMSLLRYFVFTIQNVLMLYMVGVDLPIIDLIFLISLMYFIMAAVPTFFITELPTRSSVMILLFIAYFELGNVGLPYALEMRLLLVASVVWLINIILPSIPGVYFLTSMSVLRKEKK